MDAAPKDGRLPNRFHELYIIEVCCVTYQADGTWSTDEMVGTVMVDEIGYFSALRAASDTFKRLNPEFRGQSLSLGVLARSGVFATH